MNAESEQAKISRRSFVKSAGAVGVSLFGAAALASCSAGGTKQDSAASDVTVETPVVDGKVATLTVPTSAVIESSSFDEVKASDYVKLEHTFTLPIGTQLIWSSASTVLALIPGNLVDGGALITLASVRLKDGRQTQLLKAAVGQKEGFIIYTAASSDEALAWVECEFATNNWRLYIASLIRDKVGEPKLADEGDALYEPPQPQVSGTKVYWQRMPDPDGSASTENSYLKCVHSFEQDVRAATEVVVTSTGRFATTPQIAEGLLCVTPRASADGIYYQLTALEISTDKVVNSVVLPPSMRISNAVYTQGHFSFATTSNYDYADGLAIFGTYLDLGDGSWLHINRAPSFAIARLGSGNKSLVAFKSSQSIVGLDVAKKRFMVLDLLPDSAIYGDILVGAGQQQRLITYTTVYDDDATLGAKGKVVVRTWLSVR